MKKNLIRYVICIVLSGASPVVYGQFISNTGINLVNTAFVTTNGDWTNASGSAILNNGTILTSASFANNGTLDIGSTGGFVLDYTSDFSFQPGGVAIGFLSKKGIGKALVTGSVSVKDSLVLDQGVITLLNSSDTIAIQSSAQLIAKDTFFIEGGMIARAGTGDLLFPFGKDGLYLPLKLYKVQAERVTASILDAPVTHTAGPGVDALIAFPYAWRVVGKAAADTSAYVEFNYPVSLPVVANPVVVREIDGKQYASMGARLIANDGARATVKSYSRRLNGLFTVAQGFPSDPVTDSLALVALFSSTGGKSWKDTTNWGTGTIDTWFGVQVAGQSIVAVELPGNNLVGPVADQLADILSLQTVNLSNNHITTLPDFSLNPEIASLNVSNNNLDFSSLEPNASVAGINYLVQGDIGTPVVVEIPVGSSHELSLPPQGTGSQYLWKHNGAAITGAISASYTLPGATRETMGEYIAEVTNPSLPGLVLQSATQEVLAYAELSGRLFAGVDVPATAGELTLFKVQPGAFEPVDTVNVGADGSYQFGRVILDDYQVRGFADTLVHTGALPTYYENTIFWEEADTLVVGNNILDLNIISEVEPGPPSGKGSISGYLQEDDGTGRTMGTEKNKKVARAGVSARRVERTGRTKGEILTLVAYVFTDEQGEFTLPNLPAGEYRLNFQYPGYPMDETSYTTIFIGAALESQVMVEANVLNGKINVRKLVITGLYEAENYHAEVFPNPAVEHIQLNFAGEVRGRHVTMSDMRGKKVQSLSAEKKDLIISVGKYPKGIYILRINEKEHTVKTLKVSIE